MGRIAVCDDERDCLNRTKAFLQKFNQQQLASSPSKEYLEPAFFESPSALLNSMTIGERYDIYLLDIEMPQTNGIELARRIREKDKAGLLIFLTDFFDYVLEGYHVAAFRYIPKSQMEQLLPEALKEAIGLITYPAGSFLLETEEGLLKLRVEDLLYAEKEGREVILRMKGHQTYRKKQGIAELFEEIGSRELMFIDRGCFINSHYIRGVSEGYVYLSEEEIRLPVSRRMLPKVRESLAKHWEI